MSRLVESAALVAALSASLVLVLLVKVLALSPIVAAGLGVLLGTTVVAIPVVLSTQRAGAAAVAGVILAAIAITGTVVAIAGLG